MIALKPGDVLLLKPNKDIVHSYLQDNFGNIVDKIATAVTGQKYLHAELYLGEGWVLSATVNGVRLNKYSTSTIIKNFDIHRATFDYDAEKIRTIVKDYHNLRYDFISLYLNIIDTISSIFGIKFQFPYDTKYMVICSELIARIYKDLYGIEFEGEYTTPQDLTKKFKKVWCLQINEYKKDLGDYLPLFGCNRLFLCFNHITKFVIIISEVGNIK